MLKSKIGSAQEVVLPDFPEDENTVTATVTKSRRVSFGTNFVKEFIVGSAVSAQCMSEYEQVFHSSDSSNTNSSHSVLESGNLDHSSFVMPDGVRVHKSFPTVNQPSEFDSVETHPKPPKFSSTICFSADSPTADMEFTEGCLTLAKSILDKKNKDMTVIIQAKPKEPKEVEKIREDEAKYYNANDEDDDEESQCEMSMTKCLKAMEVNVQEGKVFESEKTKIFSKFEDEMSITRCSKIFMDRRRDNRWEESKENQMPLDMIIRHLDKDNSDLENDLFNSEKSFNSMLNDSPFDVSDDSEEFNFNEPVDMSIDLQPNNSKGFENATSSPAALTIASPVSSLSPQPVTSPVPPPDSLHAASAVTSLPPQPETSPAASLSKPSVASPAAFPLSSLSPQPVTPISSPTPLPAASPVPSVSPRPGTSPASSPLPSLSLRPVSPVASLPKSSVASPAAAPPAFPGMEPTESANCDLKPSLIDVKVIENLKEQSQEPGCVWSLEKFQHPQNCSEGALLLSCGLLESSTTIHFRLNKSKEDGLYSCSIVTESDISLNRENQLRLSEYWLVVEFGFQQLHKYHTELKQKVKTIRHIPHFLDQINLFMLKMNTLLCQIHSILTLYPGSSLKGSLLSFRLFSFPVLFSCVVSIDLTSLFKLSKSSLLFVKDFGSLDENKIREIFQDCLKCENSLCEFVVQSTKYLIELERESGYVSKRSHIELLPPEYRF